MQDKGFKAPATSMYSTCVKGRILKAIDIIKGKQTLKLESITTEEMLAPGHNSQTEWQKN